MFFLGQIDCNKETKILIVNWVFKAQFKLSYVALFTGGKKCFEKPLLASCKKSEKSDEQFLRKKKENRQTDKHTTGRMVKP